MSNHIYSEYLNESTNSSNKFICQYVECRKPLPAKNGKYCDLKCCNRERNRQQSVIAAARRKITELEYSKNPKLCQQCNSALGFYQTLNGPAKFCNHSCAAARNNSIRSPESRAKQRQSVTRTARTTHNTPGPHSRIFWKKCPITGKYYHNRTPDGGRRRQSPYARDLKDIYYCLSRFKFNVYHFPELFDLTLLENNGWYSCPGKKRKNKDKNTTGVSRDHLYSVSTALESRIHPLIISHPVNCQLMLHKQNKIKHNNCSITLDELLTRILAFDNRSNRVKTHDLVVSIIESDSHIVSDIESLRSML
ncbi:hypothetical protein UFOVP29_13 [uncultured Caudovirales phage]|uniref:Uncharacterized protein n=1 Tax=uncultured Caudovirales phage TaxID=2100421 RepID=A0A6J5KQ87_9CAUD|nr:hypothetical protein UFOVP29_13 [uncultured Caudovirales phage]